MSIPLARHLVAVFLVTGTFAAAGLSACSNGGGAGGFGDDASGSSTSSSGSSTDSGSEATSSTSSGGHTDSGGTGSGGTGRVASNVQYDDAGLPLCGAAGCNLKTNECCVTQSGVGTCMAQGAACGMNVAVFRCVQKSDCPGNQICCGVADSIAMTAGSQCEDVSTTGGKCTPMTNATQTQGSAQFCQTNAECKTGQCIWQDCTVGILQPSLTMCGIQSAAPFNCKAH